MSSYLELVKTKYARLICQIPRNRFDGITTFVAHIPLRSVNALMHVNHERMKMYSSLTGDVQWESLVEQVH